MTFFDIIEFTLWNNSGRDYVVALAVLMGLFAILKIFELTIIDFFKKRAKKTKIRWDDAIIDFINWQFYFYVSLYFSSLTLELPSLLERVLKYLLIIFTVYYVTQGLSKIVNYFTINQIEKRKKSDNAQNTSMIKAFGIIFKVAIYCIALLMVLANLGLEITPLIASLGVGGIAIAIALQAVLADLFAAFAIYFDKPFKEGDFIIIGNDMGVVNKIGIKTTRITTLQGQELIISNSDMTNARVNNYQKMEKRRVVFSFGVEYSTPLKKLKKIDGIVKKAVETTDL